MSFLIRKNRIVIGCLLRLYFSLQPSLFLLAFPRKLKWSLICCYLNTSCVQKQEKVTHSTKFWSDCHVCTKPREMTNLNTKESIVFPFCLQSSPIWQFSCNCFTTVDLSQTTIIPLYLFLSVMTQTITVAILPDAINMINVKLCMMVVLTEFYSFIPHSATLIVFQGHSSVKQFSLKMLCFCPIKGWLRQVDHVHTTISDLRTCSREIINIFPRLKKKIIVGFFSDTIQARFFSKFESF